MEYINALNDEVIVSDGHYSFLETVAFTEADGDLYDIFIYLYCSPENLNICNRIYLSATDNDKAPGFATYHNLVATKSFQYRFFIKLKSLSAVSGPVLPVCFD